MYYVKNPYPDDFTIRWSGEEYILKSGAQTAIPDDAAMAYIPSPEFLKSQTRGDTELDRINRLFAVLFLVKNTWGKQISKYVPPANDKKTANTNFLQFLDKFECTSALAASTKKKQEHQTAAVGK